MATVASLRPASNSDCVTAAPRDQIRLGAVSSLLISPLSQPPVGCSISDGKLAARATPMLALATATARSAEAMSGRRCSTSDGTPTGSDGGDHATMAGASLKEG